MQDLCSFNTLQATGRLLPAVPTGGNLVSFPARLPSVPVLLATRLQLELLLGERLLDLQSVARVILSDPGATLQILRRSGEEQGLAGEHTERVEDCLAGMDTDSWVEALFAGALMPKGTKCGELFSAWRHAREIAQHMEALAHPLGWVSPERAYLVGLLHELWALPALLEWEPTPATAGLSCTMLARAWSFPLGLTNALREAEESGTPWSRLLRTAHRLAADTDKVA